MLFSPAEWSAMKLSLWVSLLSVVIQLPFTAWLAWTLARRKVRFSAFIEAFCNLPQVLPPVVTGLLLLSLLGKHGFVGQYLYQWFGVVLPFSTAGVVVVSMVVSFPIMLGFFKSAFEMVDKSFEEAAQTLGYSRFRAVLKFTIPMSLPGLATGVVLAFARCLGEFGATITFAGNIQGSTQTIPLAVYAAFQSLGSEGAMWRLVLVSVVLSVSALLVTSYFKNRRQ